MITKIIMIRGYLSKELYLKLRLSDTISLIFIYLQRFTKEKYSEFLNLDNSRVTYGSNGPGAV